MAAIAAVTLVLGGCTTNGGVTTITDAQRISNMQEELSNPAMDLSRVTVAHLNVGGKSVQVSSIMSVVLGQAGAGRDSARTIARINADHAGITLFTRDSAKPVAYLVSVPFDEFQRRGAIVFPVLGPKGELAETKIVFEKVLGR